MKPAKFWTLDEARADIDVLRLVIGGYRQKAYWIPTEVIVYSPKLVTMESAKCWRTEYSMYGLEGRSSFLVEVWDERGDDGHTQWELIGYALITESQLRELVDSEGGLLGVWGRISSYDEEYEFGFQSWPVSGRREFYVEYSPFVGG